MHKRPKKVRTKQIFHRTFYCFLGSLALLDTTKEICEASHGAL